MTEGIVIALIGLLGTVTTALGVVTAAWLTVRKEAKDDRELADRTQESWELLVSSLEHHCSLPDVAKAGTSGATDGKPSIEPPS